MAFHRIFTALSFRHFESELTTFQEKIASRISGVKWVEPKDYHLTLHFFASLEDGELENLKKIYREKSAGTPSWKFGLEGLGGFPDLKHPKILWSKVHGGDLSLLSKFHAEASQSLAAAGFPVESRPFHPHITIGRARRSGIYIPRDLPEFKTHLIRFSEVSLYESFLEPDGARYEVLEQFHLAAV